jgi:hypothetical protein
MSSEEIMCKGCRRLVMSTFEFCPYCGTSLGVIEKKMMFDTTRDLRKNLVQNANKYKREIKQFEEIRNIIDSKDPGIVDVHRQIANDLFGQFPQLKRVIEGNPEAVFKIFLIDIPYESRDGTKIHNCLLQKLSQKNGFINLSCNFAEIAVDLYSLDIPMWAPIPVGDQLLHVQRNEIIDLLPEPQRKFMNSAEPWAICNQIYNIEGRWVVWRVVNHLEGLDEFIETTNTVPVNFHFFTGFKYSHLFPILSTPRNGELIVGILEENEEEEFLEKIQKLNSSYSLDSRIEPITICISKDFLENSGIITYSTNKFMQKQIGHLHTNTISAGILEEIHKELAKITKKNIVQTEKKSDEFREQLAEEILEFSKGGMTDIMRILRPLPRKIRLEYRI